MFAVAPQERRDQDQSKRNSAEKATPGPNLKKRKENKEDEESKVAKDREMIYKSVRRRGREPLSLELDKGESEAAKTAMG